MVKQQKEDTQQSSAMASLLAEHDVSALPKVGTIIQGTVLSESKNEVHLDIEGITTGVIRGRELYDESGEYSNLKIGDEVQATVLELENENNEMELSFRQAGHKKAWTDLEQLYKERVVIEACIIDANRGGLMVRVGRVVGFLPVSQLTTEHYPRVEGGDKNKILEILQTFISHKFAVKIIDLNESEDKLIVSEKAAMEEKQRELIAQYKIDDIIDGIVTGVVDFGVFVEFGPKLEGLVHISELAWQRIDDPRTLMKVGDPIKAKIIAIDGTKISLSIKRLQEDPWKKAVERYSVGETVKGKVMKLNSFGAFVELDPEIHGLAHISELSDKVVRDPSEIVTPGKEYSFQILSIDAKNHRLGLSMKSLKKPKEEKQEAETPKPEAQTESAAEEPAASVPAEQAAERIDGTEKSAEGTVNTPLCEEIGGGSKKEKQTSTDRANHSIATEPALTVPASDEIPVVPEKHEPAESPKEEPAPVESAS